MTMSSYRNISDRVSEPNRDKVTCRFNACLVLVYMYMYCHWLNAVFFHCCRKFVDELLNFAVKIKYPPTFRRSLVLDAEFLFVTLVLLYIEWGFSRKFTNSAQRVRYSILVWIEWFQCCLWPLVSFFIRYVGEFYLQHAYIYVVSSMLEQT